MIAPIHPPARFRPGQLVQHKRYGYRGVVVAVDAICKAPREWYESNPTQPDRSQPWYHVLVDGAPNTTYAAQTSLEKDTAGTPVAHPLIDAFFSAFDGEEYVRNDRPWPE
ncbi:MAG: heat shock protein HspQ [Planctomycetes bacterium]|nr:heat shock protein HspQ [Planctomycetota bacterium]